MKDYRIGNLVEAAEDVIKNFVEENKDDLNWGKASNLRAGGQHVNAGPLIINLTHIPSNTTVSAIGRNGIHVVRQLAVIKLMIELYEKV